MLFIAMNRLLLLIQAQQTCLMNTMTLKGLDDHTSVGIGGAIVRNGMSPKLVAELYRCCITWYLLARIVHFGSFQ